MGLVNTENIKTNFNDLDDKTLDIVNNRRLFGQSGLLVDVFKSWCAKLASFTALMSIVILIFSCIYITDQKLWAGVLNVVVLSYLGKSIVTIIANLLLDIGKELVPAIAENYRSKAELNRATAKAKEAELIKSTV